MKSFAEIIAGLADRGPRRLAIAGAINDELEAALQDAASRGLAVATPFATAPLAVDAVRSGAADVLMKGSVDSGTFLKAVLDGERGLRCGSLVSHALVLEARGRLLIVTDGGIVLNPTLEQKAAIIANALPIARRLGIARPRVAVLAASEQVNPRMPETVDAAALAAMEWPQCVVEGPLAVDLAMSRHAAEAKGVGGEVPGRADILMVPSVLVGNIFAKGIMYFSECRAGGIVAGTSKPVTFLSRSDSAETKLHTIALGLMMCGDSPP